MKNIQFTGQIGFYFLAALVIALALLIVGILLLIKKKGNKLINVMLVLTGGGMIAYLLLSGIGILWKLDQYKAASVSLIGGADGPTSVFLAGKVGISNYGMLIVGIFFLALSIFILVKKRIPFLKSYDGVKDIPGYCVTMGYGVLAAGILLLIGGFFSFSVVLLTLVCIAIAMVTLAAARKFM